MTVDGAGAAISAEGLDAALTTVSDQTVALRGSVLAARLNVGAGMLAGANVEFDSAALSKVLEMGTLSEFARETAQIAGPQVATMNGSALNNATVRDIVAATPQDTAVASSNAAAPSQNRSYAPSAQGILPRYVSVPAGGSSSQSSAKIVYNGSGVLLVPNATLPAGYSANHLRIQRQGVAQSALAVTPNGLLLYGPGYSDAYTGSDVFFASPSNTPTPAGVQTLATGLFAANNSPVTGAPATMTQQYTDVYFDWGLRPYNYPPYFSSQYLTSGGTASFTLNVSNASSAASSLVVNAWSLTSTPGVSPDHALQAFVNGVAVGQAVWTGGGRFVAIAFQVPAGVFVAGNNTVDLVTPALANVSPQIALLHSMSVNYNMSLNGPGSINLTNSSSDTQLYEVANMATSTLWVVYSRYSDSAALVP